MPTLRIIPVGFIDLDVRVITPGDTSGERVDVPVFAYLVDTGQGLALLDTGCSRRLMTSPADILGAGVRALTPRMDPAVDHITARLRGMGVDPQDIDVVLSSHLHWDHAGANADPAFERAEFWIQRAEWEATLSSPRHYADPGFKPPSASQIKLLSGDTAVAPGVTLVSTPGHTPGHQSLMVQFKDGTGVFITSDAVYSRQHYDPSHVGAAVDPAESARSVARIQQLCHEHRLSPFFSHDPHQVPAEGWRLAPLGYEAAPPSG
jgi:N-acyl homoserine lactone hydrolase